jgi:hypothetical protein
MDRLNDRATLMPMQVQQLVAFFGVLLLSI